MIWQVHMGDAKIKVNLKEGTIELEGSEEFVKIYFDKLQQMLTKSPDEVKEEPKVAKALPAKRIKVKKAAKVEISAPKKVIKAAKVKISDKKGKITSIDTVIGLIQGSPTGITTAELMKKTGYTPKKIWSITSRAAKMGKIKRPKLGTNVAIG